ncbi:MAG: PhzF family phenazine biosynthesis protein [Bryobacteraceae bacterium]
MEIPIFQVDAFTSRPFAGNPAAVCLFREFPDDAVLQAIAAENNLSETAFLAPCGQRYRLRWMTPTVEVDLCGHATLASAFVLLNFIDPRQDSVGFETRSGELRVTREGDLYTLDLPVMPPSPCTPHQDLIPALGEAPEAVLSARDYMAVYADEEQVRRLTPDMSRLAALDRFGIIVTAPGRDCEFVSRFFAPAKGVPEDPVTGSAHCSLAPYWTERLGARKLRARQISRRGGELTCELAADRVRLSGRAVLFLRGTITL